MPQVMDVDVSTGEITVREMTEAEAEQYEKDKLATETE
jgi:hypothetical protein